jgi:hypothetical protein
VDSRRPFSRWKGAAFVVVLFVCAVASMTIGTPWTRSRVSTWIRAILLGPGGRARRLRLIATPIFYSNEPQYYYTGTLHPALVGFGLVTYVLILAAAAQSSAGKPKTRFHAVRSPVRLVSAAVTVSFGVTCVVVPTNAACRLLPAVIS